MDCDYTDPGGTPLERIAQQQDGTHSAPCARSCEANAFQIEIRRISAERDALAAKLAELEGQEPVSAQCRFTDGRDEWRWADLAHHRHVQANPSEWDGYETRALYASPVPAEIEESADDHQLAETIMSDCGVSSNFEVLKERIAKRIARRVCGALERTVESAPSEPVNARLLTAARAAVAFIEGKPDAVEPFGLLREAIAAAESAPKAARLTRTDIAKALASAGLKPEDYREDGEILPLVIAIESAALRKNGIEVAE